MSAEEFHEASHGVQQRQAGEEGYIEDVGKAQLVAEAVNEHLTNDLIVANDFEWAVDDRQNAQEAIDETRQNIDVARQTLNDARQKDLSSVALDSMKPKDIDGDTTDIGDAWEGFVQEYPELDPQISDPVVESAKKDLATQERYLAAQEKHLADTKVEVARIPASLSNFYEDFFDKYPYFADKSAAEFVQGTKEHIELREDIVLTEATLKAYDNVAKMIKGVREVVFSENTNSELDAIEESASNDDRERKAGDALDMTHAFIHANDEKSVDELWISLLQQSSEIPAETLPPDSFTGAYINSEVLEIAVDAETIALTLEASRQANEAFFDSTPKQQFERFVTLFEEVKAHHQEKLTQAQQKIDDLEKKFSNTEENNEDSSQEGAE